jgi:hypothetical protein
MTSTRDLALAAGLLGLGAITAGFLTVTHPTSERAALTGGRAAVHGELERLESAVPAGRAADEHLWRAHLDVFERERVHGHPDVAIRVLHDAYGAALESRSWESMIAIGDAFMTVGRAPGNASGARMNARQAYLTALIRARRDHSVEGALRSADAFEQLGDRDAVEQCLHIAGLLTEGDERAQRRIREVRRRWAARQLLTEF